ncbi:MAG: hypothetical protein CBB68_04025 [Rhodospirillaceae bacterium TMED8]|mgnify:CR=1 FL=1|nr:2-deoxy-D-gluconate 3-dehydrogenase [Magnetovibrio sp.]OUT52040.1 MAG: hypothetical protein CBB68_04025 [Rhodospirillaceae bacterium TMED8]|tara:strand:- start:1935 stop:2684 length:750 start_codon:yes stop_codon:yes gene_type:complete
MSDQLFDLKDKVILIAGAAGGLGLPIARALADRGARLALCARNNTELGRLEKGVPSASFYEVDITDEGSLGKAIQKIQDEHGTINGGLNAAGLWGIGGALDLDVEEFRECLDVNITGAFLFSRACARVMVNGGGRIIHIASVSSYVANPDYAAYASSKAAVAQMVKVLAREWAQHNININAIGPAMTLTPLTKPRLEDPEFSKNALDKIPMGRFGDPNDLIGIIVLLLTAGGEFITGQTIYVDGGRTLV